MGSVFVCPLHVKNSLNDIYRLKGKVDLLIVVTDARSPGSTGASGVLPDNLAESGLKVLEIMGKPDLSDLSGQNAFNLKDARNRRAIIDLIRDELGVGSGEYSPHYQVLVVGFPNVGKSTLINLLRGKNVTASENTPGKTRKIVKFPIGDNIWVYDTPGIFVPRKIKGEMFDRLFLINSIPHLVKDFSGILERAYEYLIRYYREQLEKSVGFGVDGGYGWFLERLAARYGLRLRGGGVDAARAEVKFLYIIRSGKIRMNWDRDDE